MGYFLILIIVLSSPFNAFSEVYSTKQKRGCPSKVEHVPDPSLEYKPGADKDGWAIVPADIVPSPFPEGTFDTTRIGLNIPIAPFASGVAALGATDPRFDLSETQAQIGTIEVDQDGTTRLNGQVLETNRYDSLDECE